MGEGRRSQAPSRGQSPVREVGRRRRGWEEGGACQGAEGGNQTEGQTMEEVAGPCVGEEWGKSVLHPTPHGEEVCVGWVSHC